MMPSCWSYLFLLLMVKLAPITGASQRSLDVTVTPSGEYSVIVNGVTWLQSGPTFFNSDCVTWSTESKGDTGTLLQLLSNTNNRGTDVIGGDYSEIVLQYQAGNASIQASIREYDDANLLFFKQRYVNGAGGTAGPGGAFNQTIAGFPSFRVEEGDEPLGFLSYGGFMLGDTHKTTATWENNTSAINDGIAGGPLAIFNGNGDTLLIVPFKHFMAASLWHDRKPGGHVSWGIMGGVNSIPANFDYQTIIVLEKGINKAFSWWGSLMTIMRPQILDQRKKNIENDVTLNYMGYWTDNGAYYYYNTEKNKTYQDTLLDVKTEADLAKIPYRYLQLDSWWYPKDDLKAVTKWEAMPDVFPQGIKYVKDQTGLQFAAHNRYWSKKTTYAKQNGGMFDFVIGHYGSLPNDAEFWKYLFMMSKQWGLTLYEQDWMNIQTSYLAALQTDLNLGRDWLIQMGTAASEMGINIQYCMSNPRHALQSLDIPSVTQIRVTMDYLYRSDLPNWKIGVTSIFANALNLVPYKDTFWTTSVEPGNPYNKTDANPVLESVVASLSGGPVGPGDKIGSTNRSLLMRCCRSDGLILKPERPATAIDKQIINDAFNWRVGQIGEIWYTSSFIRTGQNSGEYGVLFAADIKGRQSIVIQDLGLNQVKDGVYYPYNNIHDIRIFTNTTMIDLRSCSVSNFCLYYFVPLLQSNKTRALLGEINKWIQVSPKRIYEIDISTSGDVSVTLCGVTGETVTLAYWTGQEVKEVHCLFTTTGIAVARVDANSTCSLSTPTSSISTSFPLPPSSSPKATRSVPGTITPTLERQTTITSGGTKHLLSSLLVFILLLISNECRYSLLYDSLI